jgi:hypothetical protein
VTTFSAKRSPRPFPILFATLDPTVPRSVPIPQSLADELVSYTQWALQFSSHSRDEIVDTPLATAVVTEDQLVSRFEDACQPHHDTRGSTGYKSLTFTLPKEVSLFAEGHREEAKAAMHAAVPRPSGEIPWPFACPRPHRSFRRMASPSSGRPAAGWQQDSLGTAGSSRTVVGHLLAPCARMPVLFPLRRRLRQDLPERALASDHFGGQGGQFSQGPGGILWPGRRPAFR